jgi:HEAT repeat protein
MCSRRLLLSLVLIYGINTIVVSQNAPFAGNRRLPTFAEKLQQHHIALTKSALVNALRNPDAEVRSLAAAQLAENRARDTIPSIIGALTAERVPLTRVNIAFALAQMGEKKGFAELKSTCDDARVPSHFRIFAASYLLYFNDEHCLPSVLGMLRSDAEPTTRMQALSILNRFEHIQKKDFRAMHHLVLKALTDPDPSVRLTASSTLSSIGNSSDIQNLRNAIADEQDEAVRSQMENDLQRLTANTEY